MHSLHRLGLIILLSLTSAFAGENLIEDPSFELTKERDRFGLVFAMWGGWKYEGDCEFAVGRVAHSGKTSCLLVGGAGAKIRVAQNRELEPGRYRITAFVRGLDIGLGTWNMTTEFMFDGKYIPLAKNGTFGWTKLSYVGEIKEKKQAGPSFGMMAPGLFWIDDVTLEKVGADVALTEKPVLGNEEAPIAPPGGLGAGAVRCAECGYRNMPAWKNCYACGTALDAKKAVAAGPAIKRITSFEDKNPFDGGVVSDEHATDGKKSLRLDKGYAIMDAAQDWSGYDYLKADLHTDAKDPLELYVEIRDTATQDYWTRVNYTTVVPPGASTLVLPVKQLYVGEKSRPGRALILNAITKLVFSIGDKPSAPVFIDNIRLERDDSAAQVQFAGLHAFDFGTGASPLMEGFTPITPATLYSKGRGYGLKDAKVWRAFDVLQPDPLYQDFICIESGGLAVDVPNGKYRVFVNVDNPSGFWGEYQTYRRRAILAQGKEVVVDTMDFASFKKKYFCFWDVEDLPTDNTFDKYQKAYFHEKTFDVDVTDGQLNIAFLGENWACSVSAVVIFPVAQAAEGERFLKWVEARRRFAFDNYFKRILHRPTVDPLQPSADDKRRGYVVFTRDFMKELFDNDTPFKSEIGQPLAAESFAGQAEPLTLAVLPLRDLGKGTVTASDLAGPGGKIPSSAIDIGFVSYRISRVTSEGTVYTISPRLVMPTNSVALPPNIARRFWLTIKTPADAAPGIYKGKVTITVEKGTATSVPIELRVRKGTLDPLDIPAGPFSYTINVPWPDDPAAAAFNEQMIERSLRKMREYGFTTFSGVPVVHYKGFKDGQPLLDFATADAQMKLAKQLGFLAVVTYGGGVTGLNAYNIDNDAMKAAGFTDYSEFIKAIYSAIQRHADDHGWLPVFWNLADEPLGDDLKRSAENAAAYRKAFPKGPPFFTGASSFTGPDAKNNPHFQLSRALHAVSWNGHDEAGVRLLHNAGSDWAFYNGGNRWTYGDYLYKAAKQFGMKFRLSWHWNATAGDPYYALDCREDDYAWCNATPDGRLVPSVEFERLRAGLNDYRHLLTLARLAKEKPGTPAAKAAEDLIAARLAAFKLGQRDHDEIFPPDDWQTSRRKLADAIEALRK